MKSVYVSLIFGTIFTFVVPVRAQDVQRKWVGYEIIGNHHATRADIIKSFPLIMGGKYEENREGWATTCRQLQEKFVWEYAHCGALTYLNGDTYMVVDAVEADQAYRSQFRKIPATSIPLVNAEVKSEFDSLYKKLWQLFAQGKMAIETASAGYLDYSDPEMHETVLKLAKSVPPFRENILEVLAHDQDDQKRADAANLLNWTLNDLEETVYRASKLLDDPSDGVRNNISRFTMHFVDRVKTPKYRHDVINQMLVQLDRPSHGDRNKALFNLLSIVQKFPEDMSYIKTKGLPLIQYIAATSVVSNVQGIAVQLLELLQK